VLVAGHAWPLLCFPHALPAGIPGGRHEPRLAPRDPRASPSSSGLSSGTAPWRHAGGGAWWTGGRREGECGWARCQGARKYSLLRHVHPSALPRADILFPHSPAPAPYDSRRSSPQQAQRPRPRQRVGPGGVARAAGRPVVPEPRRRRASQGEQVLF
jgi:hypothetical protein